MSNRWGPLLITGSAYWAIVSPVIILGSFFNGLLTGRLPLILALLSAFLLRAIARWLMLGTSLWVTLRPMTGVVFYLFTLYMLPDPGTTPIDRRNQIIFGASLGFVYGIMILLEVRFTIITCTGVCLLHLRRMHEIAGLIRHPIRGSALV